MKHTFIKEKIKTKYIPSVGDFFVLAASYEDLGDSCHAIFLLAENNIAIVVSAASTSSIGNAFALDALQYRNLHFFKVEMPDIKARVIA